MSKPQTSSAEIIIMPIIPALRYDSADWKEQKQREIEGLAQSRIRCRPMLVMDNGRGKCRV